VSVLADIATVTGWRVPFLIIVVLAGALGATVGIVGRARSAFVLTVGLLLVGLIVYIYTLSQAQQQLLTAQRLLADTAALFTGLSILRFVRAGAWAIAVVPAPVFLSWALLSAGRYVLSAAAGGVALGLVILTGDASLITALTGVVGFLVTVAAATVNQYDGGIDQFDTIIVLLSVIIVLSTSVSAVPGSGNSPLVPEKTPQTVDASLTSADQRIEVLGSIDLSPQVRFTVESSRPSYWRTGAYNRYTGDGWVRTGEAQPYRGQLSSPPGSSQPVQQTITTQQPISILPAAWKPIRIEGSAASQATVTTQGGLVPRTSLNANTEYTVTSRLPLWTPAQLRRAGTAYPAEIDETYREVPADTSDRVTQRTNQIIANASADTVYDASIAIERYLEENKQYSLSVSKPDGNTAESFLFEMDAGYCVYYASTMAVMLRTQGIPTRFVTGYTPGERIDSNTHVVRGLNSHAWVEVYFPDAGWVRFDPTPATERQSVEGLRLSEARQQDTDGVDLNESTPTPTPSPGDTASENGASGANTAATPASTGQSQTTPEGGAADNGSTGSTIQTPGIGGRAPDSLGASSSSSVSFIEQILPAVRIRRLLAAIAIGLIGVGAAMRQSDSIRHLRALLIAQSQWLTSTQQRTGVFSGLLSSSENGRESKPDPDSAVAYAHKRAMAVLAYTHRPRRPGETSRTYRDALSLSADHETALQQIEQAYERSKYGDGVSASTAATAVTAADFLIRTGTPFRRHIARFRSTKLLDDNKE
jgi:Transglutaminase-like enzymes, putative cysteine proteases